MQEKPTVDGTINALRAFAKEHKISNRRLALLAGLNKNTLTGFYGEDWSPNAATLRKLGAVMDWYPGEQR